MEEQKRKFIANARSNNCLTLPPISASSRDIRAVIASENTLKLCRVGVNKSKFINFDLKNPNDTVAQAAYTPDPPRIPLMVCNSNRFSHLKQVKPKRTHLLLTRVHNFNTQSRHYGSLPSLSLVSSPLPNKRPAAQGNHSVEVRDSLFIT